LGENEQAVDYSRGVKPTEPPSAPIPGQPKNEEKPEGKSEEKGIPTPVKTAGALVGIVTAVAGVLFGVQQIVQSNRAFQVQLAKDEREARDRRDEADHKFAKEMQAMRDQADKDRLTLSAQNTARGAELAKAEADKRSADAKIAETARLQAEAEAQKAKAELDKTDLQIKHDEALQEKNSEIERRKEEANQLKELQASIVKLRLVPPDTADFAALGTITAALSAQGTLKDVALGAIDSRLDSFPSRAESEFIFDALPDAGFSEAMDIVVRANRRAWKALGGAVAADFRLEMSKPEIRHEPMFVSEALVYRKLAVVLGGKTTETIDRDFHGGLMRAAERAGGANT
jgi:hypothetical protein